MFACMKLKRIAIVLFSLLMLSAALLPYFCFYATKLNIAQEARKALLRLPQSAQLETLEFTEAEFLKLEFELFNPKEFLWQGKMYDIIELQHAVDKVRIVCFADEAESKAIKQLLTQLKSALTDAENGENELVVTYAWFLTFLPDFEVKSYPKDLEAFSVLKKSKLAADYFLRIKKPPQVELNLA